MNGTIKKYFEDKGFGFIKTDNKEVFFHISNLADASEGPQLREGLDVTFEVGQNDKGDFAKNIRVA